VYVSEGAGTIETGKAAFRVAAGDPILLVQSAREGTPGLRQILAGWTGVLVALLYSSMQPLSAKARSETQIIEQARSLMLAEQTRDMPLEDIAKSLNISYTSFRRTFREHTGASPHQYRLHLKISAARELLRSTDLRVKEISYRCGFDDEQYFCRIFKRQTGNTPVEFRARSRRPRKPGSP
jgi:transcriptional regulator GlxA family with amidase domain